MALTEEATSLMIKCYESGMSGKEIAIELTALLGKPVTKNVVAGSIGRLREKGYTFTRVPHSIVTDNKRFWTDELRELVCKLWETKTPRDKMVQATGAASWNSIKNEIAKLRKIPEYAKRLKNREDSMRPVKRVALKAPEPQRLFEPVPLPDVTPLNLPLTALERHQCHYPYGQGRDVTFCGHPVAQDSNGDKRPYCAAHAAVCYQQNYVPEPAAALQRTSWGTGYGVGPVPGAFHGRGHGVID